MIIKVGDNAEYEIRKVSLSDSQDYQKYYLEILMIFIGFILVI